MRIVEINELFCWRTTLRQYGPRACRAEYGIIPVKFLDCCSLLMTSQAPFFDPYERSCHLRKDLTCTAISLLKVAGLVPAPTASAENRCISRHRVRTNPGSPRAACQCLGVPNSSVKNPGAVSFHHPPLSAPAEVCKTGHPSIPASSTPNISCSGEATAQLLALALRQSLNISPLIITFARNSSFKRCIRLVSEEQLHRGKITALWKRFPRCSDHTAQNVLLR